MQVLVQKIFTKKICYEKLFQNKRQIHQIKANMVVTGGSVSCSPSKMAAFTKNRHFFKDWEHTVKPVLRGHIWDNEKVAL
jgi:hypothetical protein